MARILLPGVVAIRYQAELESSFEAVDEEVSERLWPQLNQAFEGAESCIIALDFAVRELLNNAVEHGNHLHPRKTVRYQVAYEGSEFVLDVWDEGAGFNLGCILEQVAGGTLLRERARGLAAISELGFRLEVGRGHVKATLHHNNML